MGVSVQKNHQNGNKTKILLIVLAGLLVIAVAVAAVFFVNGKMVEKSYSEAITSAEKYLARNDYEEAIVHYQKAISVNPKATEGYIGLANVYVAQDQTSKAKAILKKGYKKTNSEKIKLMLNRLDRTEIVTSDLTEKTEPEQTLDLATASQNIGWNTSFLQKAALFDYSDYQNEFGMARSAEDGSGGYLEVVHSGLDGICYYRNTEDNKEIVDVSRKTPTATGMPEKISLNSLDVLFKNFDGCVSLNRLQMLFGERVEPTTLEGRTIVEAKKENCIIRIETDSNGNVISPNAWNEIILLNANNGKSKEGHLEGIVLDAVTGEGVSGAELTFTPEDRSLETETVMTDDSGAFSVDLDPDVYTILIEAEDYIEEDFEFEIEEGRTYSGEQFVISPELTKGTARIVLEWNAEPRDLDSYLFGETDKGDDVGVCFYRRQVKSGGKTIAELDLDERNGYGPETTTIYDLNGVYTFHVADFNRTGTMKQCGATVKVYLPGKQPETITIASGADVKDIWIVCEIDHGKLNIINDAPPTDEFTPGSK